MKIISLILCFVMVFGLITGCAVKPSGPSATGEISSEVSKEEPTMETTPEIFEPTKENALEKDKETTYEWIGPQDNYPIEYLDFDYDNYPMLKGFIELTDSSQATPFQLPYTKKQLDSHPKGIFVKNNHVLAKVNKVEKLKISDRYFLKYEYEIEKVYYGNLKKGDKVNAYMNDWTEKQDLIFLGQVDPYCEGYKISVAYPRVGQYIITRIHGYEFKEELYPDIKERYYKYYNELLYKNELKIMEENYFIESKIFDQFVFDKDKKFVSTGKRTLKFFRDFKNDENATIEKLSDIDGFIEYFFIFRENNTTNEG